MQESLSGNIEAYSLAIHLTGCTESCRLEDGAAETLLYYSFPASH